MEKRVTEHMKRIPLAKPCLAEDELTAIKKVLQSGMLTEGDVTAEFEKAFARCLGVKNAVATSSCTTALDLALLAIGVGKGDEVIVPDFTYPATGNVVFHVGAKPILVDVDAKTYNINPDRVEEAVSGRTKAVIPVHLFGQSADMKSIMEIAEEHNLSVIEDAACGVGATYNGKKAGTFGNASCFSFHPRKILTTGEGGMLVTDDCDLAEKVRIMKNHGVKRGLDNTPCFIKPGYNFRLNDIASAIGMVQLKKVPQFIEERQKLARKYDDLLSGATGIITPYVAPGCNHTYQTYCVMIGRKNVRDRLITELAAKEVETQIGTYALHLQPTYEENRGMESRNLSVSEAAFKNTLSLPMYNGLGDKEQEYVCEKLMELLQSSSRSFQG